MTLKLQKLRYRRRLTGAAAVAAAVARRAGRATGVAGASAAAAPVLQTLTYTATGPGGGLYHPVGVSAANGTVYVSDTGANVVAALANGATTAFAGSLTAFGEHGDGGQATSASLYHPGGTAVDAKGDVFIADSGDNVIREVTPAGVIPRIAGTGIAGSASRARSASRPRSARSTTRRTWPSTRPATCSSPTPTTTGSSRSPRRGRSSTVAGDGVGRLLRRRPAGRLRRAERADRASRSTPQGNLYIADSANNVIRRVDAKTGIITTVAGDYAADKANDGTRRLLRRRRPPPPARSSTTRRAWPSTARATCSSPTPSTTPSARSPRPASSPPSSTPPAPTAPLPRRAARAAAPAPTASKLNTPYGVAIDQSTDDLYIADTDNSKIAAVTGLAQPGNAAGPTAPARS